MKDSDKAINGIRVASGTACYCKTCRILMTYGVNSREAMNEVAKVTSRPTFGNNWAKVLEAHARYHSEKGEVLPEAYLPSALTDEFKSAITEKPKAKPAPAKTEEQFQAAVKQFRQVKQRNERKDNRPIIERFDTRPFAGL